jgi:hypothetical protein
VIIQRRIDGGAAGFWMRDVRRRLTPHPPFGHFLTIAPSSALQAPSSIAPSSALRAPAHDRCPRRFRRTRLILSVEASVRCPCSTAGGSDLTADDKVDGIWCEAKGKASGKAVARHVHFLGVDRLEVRLVPWRTSHFITADPDFGNGNE